MSIGFEWVTQRAISILPGSLFSMSIIWDHRKIPSSIGKDIFIDEIFLLPNSIIAATGRIHHDNRQRQYKAATMYTKACHPTPCPSRFPASLQLEIITPPAFPIDGLERITFFQFVKKNKETYQVPLYIDPQSIQKISSDQILIDLSPHISKHLILD